MTSPYQVLLQRERASFLDPVSGRLAADASCDVVCPVCESASGGQQELFVSGGYRFVRCQGCGLLFANPMLLESHGQRLYDSSESLAEWARVVQSSEQRALDRSQYSALMEMVSADGSSASAPCLDISMRAGSALSVPALSPREVECVDLARATREVGRALYPDATFYGGIHEIPSSRRYELAVSFEAMEHTFAPAAFVAQVAELLVDGGVFCGVLSNVESLLVRLLGAEAPLFDGIYQKYFFHTGSLGRLLRRVGFADVRFMTAVPCTLRIVEALGRVVGGEKNLASSSAIEKLAQAAATPPLGYKLMFVARKAYGWHVPEGS